MSGPFTPNYDVNGPFLHVRRALTVPRRAAEAAIEDQGLGRVR
jgi:hypothetical protein